MYLMDFKNFTATENDNGRRVDRVIRKLLPNLPMTAIYKNIRKGFIKINNKRIKNNENVNINDVINIATFLIDSLEKQENNNDYITKTKIKIEDIFCNEYVRIINKPYDVVVQGSNDKSISLSEQILADYLSKNKHSLSFKPGPLHRLDKKTTGVLVFSQNLKGAQYVSSLIQNHLIKKTYIAIIEGYLSNKVIWNESILREKTNKTNTFNTSKIDDSGKEALTYAKPLAYGKYNNKNITLVEFIIKTGRTHQIRLHASSHGFPLLGDTAYGSFQRQQTQDFFLHAIKLEFPKDNLINLPEKVIAPLPKKFENMIKIYFKSFDFSQYITI